MPTILKRLRMERGLTQQQLADRAGVKQPTECGHENGKHGMLPATARAYAKALKFRQWWLLMEVTR